MLKIKKRFPVIAIGCVSFKEKKQKHFQINNTLLKYTSIHTEPKSNPLKYRHK